GEGVHYSAMSLPDPVQRLVLLFPNTHFPLLATRCPPPSIRAYGHNPGGIDGLGQDGIADECPGEQGILHLDTLQIRPTNTEMGEIQSVQVSKEQAQECNHVRWSITLGIVVLLA